MSVPTVLTKKLERSMIMIIHKKNRSRIFRRATYGFSFCANGRFNISKPLYEHLGCPAYISFEIIDLNWAILRAAEGLNDHSGKINFTNTSRYISNKGLYNMLISEFNLTRNDDKRHYPFYYSEYATEGGEPVAYVRMNNFSDYCYPDENGKYIREYEFIKPAKYGLPFLTNSTEWGHER